MSRKYFGTDGIRGRVGSGPITPEFVMKLGWAAGKVFANQGRNNIIIGKDTRISGYMFESALEAGIVAAGVNVTMIGPMPTPAVAYLTRTFRAACGIVISASHNPYYDNGIKFFGGDGQKLPDNVELDIERMIDEPMTTVESANLGKVKRLDDAAGRYIEFCKSTVPNNGFTLSGLRIVLDCAHGATYHVAPAVMKELGAEVISIGASPDGLNINEEVGQTSPQQLQAKVLEQRADLGIAFDGDGDRVAFVDEYGKLMDGDELLYIIAQFQAKTSPVKGVVGTLMSNLGLELALKELDIDLVRAKVGDRYVNEQMKAHGYILGGESSGHIICHDVMTTGDGIVAALKVLQALVAAGKPISALRDGMKKAPMKMINVRVNNRIDLDNHEGVQNTIKVITERLQGRGRILLRPSGTEPVIRVMVEAQDADMVESSVVELAEVVKQAVA
jgi:phosphoglucosamine mutase